MTRTLKSMGLALFCVFALGAIGAQSASAAVNHEFTSDSANGKTVLTGTSEGNEVFALTGVPLSCTDISTRGTVVGNSVDHIRVVPIFGGCTFAGSAVTIDNTGCTFTFDSDTNLNTTHFAAPAEHANVSLACDHPSHATAHIVLTGPGCTITIGTTHSGGVIVNHNLPGVRYKVITPAEDGGTSTKNSLTVEWTVRTMKALTEGANCPALGLGNPGTHSNMTWSAKTTITCYEDAEVTARNPHTETLLEGPQVNCGLTTP